jgi:hypothetical protein
MDKLRCCGTEDSKIKKAKTDGCKNNKLHHQNISIPHDVVETLSLCKQAILGPHPFCSVAGCSSGKLLDHKSTCQLGSNNLLNNARGFNLRSESVPQTSKKNRNSHKSAKVNIN